MSQENKVTDLPKPGTPEYEKHLEEQTALLESGSGAPSVKDEDTTRSDDKSRAKEKEGSDAKKAKEQNKETDKSKKPGTEAADSTKKDEPKKPEAKAEGEEDDELKDKPGDTEYTRKQKEAKRLDKTWQNANRIKEENERRDADIKAREAKVKEEADRLAREAEIHAAAEKKSRERGEDAAKEFDEAAADFEKAGKTQLASDARAKAKAIRDELGQSDQQRQQALVEDHKVKWNANLQSLKEKPEYEGLKDPKSDFYQAVTEVVNKHGLRNVPAGRGILWAAEYVRVKREADSVPGLKEKFELDLSNAQKRIAELEKKLGIPGGQPPNRKKESTGGEKPKPGTPEYEAYLERMAENVDSLAMA